MSSVASPVLKEIFEAEERRIRDRAEKEFRQIYGDDAKAKSVLDLIVRQLSSNTITPDS